MNPAAPSPHLRGRIITLGLALALALVVAMTVWTVRGSEAAAPTGAQTATVDEGAVTATVSASGNIAAATTVNVDFDGTGGVVTELLVEVGDRVRRGQALARIDDTSARLALRNAEIQLESAMASQTTATQGQTAAESARDQTSIDAAEVSLQSARVSLRQAQASRRLTDRQQDAAVRRAEQSLAQAQQSTNLAEVQAAREALIQARTQRETSLLQARQQVESAQRQVVSAQQSLSSTRASVAVNAQGADAGTVASAAAQVAAAELSVTEAQETLDDTVLRAPVAGTVAVLNGQVGQTSTATSSTTSTGSETSTGTSGFLTLTSDQSLEVEGYVAEADITDVRIGQPAVVTLSATGREVSGKVTAIDTTETITNNVVEYGVTVTLDESDDVRLGQSSQVTITTGDAQGVTRVSSSALTTIGDRTTATVRADDGTEQPVVVEIGLVGGGFTQIISGLNPGDVVVLPATIGDDAGFTFPGGGGIGGLR